MMLAAVASTGPARIRPKLTQLRSINILMISIWSLLSRGRRCRSAKLQPVLIEDSLPTVVEIDLCTHEINP